MSVSSFESEQEFISSQTYKYIKALDDQVKNRLLNSFKLISGDKNNRVDIEQESVKNMDASKRKIKRKIASKENTKIRKRTENKVRREKKIDRNSPKKITKQTLTSNSPTKKLLFYVRKFKQFNFTEKDKIDLKEYLLADRKNFDILVSKLVDMIKTIQSLYIVRTLHNIILDAKSEMSKEENRKKKVQDKDDVNQLADKKSNQTIDTSTRSKNIHKKSSKENKNVETVQNSKSVKQVKDKKRGQNIAQKQVDDSPRKSKRLEKDIDEGSRRKSLRLSSHPPGYFQTKPDMVIYFEDMSGAVAKLKRIRRSLNDLQVKTPTTTSSDSSLGHSLPKTKRRKLYQHNND